MFGDLYLPNQAEPTRAPIEEVVVLTSIFNFVNYTMNQIATVWELWTVEFTLSVVPSGVVSVRFQKTDRAAVADRHRSCSPRGAHALPKSPRRASELQMKANVSTLARSLVISLCHLLPPREHGDQDTVAAAEPNPPSLSALVRFIPAIAPP